MTYVVVLLGIFLMPLIFVVVLTTIAARKQNTTTCYTRLARRYGGNCDPGGWFSFPTVQFQHQGIWVLIDIYSTGGKHPTYYTQAHLFFSRPPPVRCEIYPEGVWSGLRKLLGMQDVEIGNPEFDNRYIIKGSDVAALRNLLNRDVCWQIELLRRLIGNDEVYILFDSRQLLVKKRSYISDYNTLAMFTELAIGLFDRAMRPSDEEIKFVKAAQPPNLAEAACQICGEMIESNVVFCRRCKTPHHHDCWGYYGACSTYGCLEKRFMRPQSKRAQRASGRMQR